ncbi:MAG: hypothetical protein V4479_06430 [Actinomycetota bacterium]
MKKLLAILATAFLGIGLAVLAVAGPASAHANNITATAACNTTDYTWTVTWSVSNDYGDSETIESTNLASVVPLNTNFGPVGTPTAIQTFQQTGITAAQNITLTLGGHWSDGFHGSDSGTITSAQFVGGCTRPKTIVVVPTFQFTEPSCTSANGSYTVPTTTGITYSLAAGTYPAAPSSSVTVTAAVTDSTKYTLGTPDHWSHTFNPASTGCTTIVDPVTPTVNVITTCGTDGSVTWTDTAAIHYALTKGDGKSGPFEVTAYAQGNNVFADGSTVKVVKTGDLGVKTTCATVPHDEFATDIVCVQDTINDTATKVGGAITVTPITGVKYTITGGTIDPLNPVVVTGTTGGAAIATTLPAGSYTVTPSALAGFTLTNPGAVPLTVVDKAGLCIPTLPFTSGTVTAVDQTCSAGKLVSGYITVALDPATLNYTLNGTQLGAKTNVAPGTYTVNMVPVPGYTIGAPTATVTVHPSSTSACGQLTTLAFTGGNLVGGGFLSASALLFMASGVFIARSRKQKQA